jgi:hypothetical protein
VPTKQGFLFHFGVLLQQNVVLKWCLAFYQIVSNPTATLIRFSVCPPDTCWALPALSTGSQPCRSSRLSTMPHARVGFLGTDGMA